MPDYSTLSSQVDLFKTKVTALTNTTLTANDLVLIASALDTLARALGVNDILNATIAQIDRVTTATDTAVATVGATANGTTLANHTSTLTNHENRIVVVENYVNTAGTNISTLSSTVTGIQSQIALGGLSNPWQSITSSYVAITGDRLLVTPAAGLIITLPTTPGIGNMVTIIDAAGTAQTTNFTVARNSSLIAGLAEDLTFNVKSKAVSLVYASSGQGWRII